MLREAKIILEMALPYHQRLAFEMISDCTPRKLGLRSEQGRPRFCGMRPVAQPSGWAASREHSVKGEIEVHRFDIFNILPLDMCPRAFLRVINKSK